MEQITDKQVNDAKRTLRAYYYQAVTSYAEDIKSDIEKGEITDREGLQERVHETCDGSSWVIYTSETSLLLFVSDNEDAYFTEGLGDGEELIDSDGIKTSHLAYYALHADLWEALDSIGIDSSWDGPEEEEEEEEEEEGEARLDNPEADAEAEEAQREKETLAIQKEDTEG